MKRESGGCIRPLGTCHLCDVKSPFTVMSRHGKCGEGRKWGQSGGLANVSVTGIEDVLTSVCFDEWFA